MIPAVIDAIHRPTTVTTVPAAPPRPQWCAQCHGRVPASGGFRVLEHHTFLCGPECRDSYVEKHIQPRV